MYHCGSENPGTRPSCTPLVGRIRKESGRCLLHLRAARYASSRLRVIRGRAHLAAREQQVWGRPRGRSGPRARGGSRALSARTREWGQLLRPVPCLDGRRVILPDLWRDGFAEDALVVGVVVVDVEVAGDLEVDGEDAQKGREGGGAELGLPGVGPAHGGVHGTVALCVGL